MTPGDFQGPTFTLEHLSSIIWIIGTGIVVAFVKSISGKLNVIPTADWFQGVRDDLHSVKTDLGRLGKKTDDHEVRLRVLERLGHTRKGNGDEVENEE